MASSTSSSGTAPWRSSSRASPGATMRDTRLQLHEACSSRPATTGQNRGYRWAPGSTPARRSWAPRSEERRVGKEGRSEEMKSDRKKRAQIGTGAGEMSYVAGADISDLGNM